MQTIINFIQKNKNIPIITKSVVSVWLLYLIFGSLFTAIPPKAENIINLIVHTTLIVVLAAFLCYTVWNIEKLIAAFKESNHKNSLFYALFHATSITLFFNPLDAVSTEIKSFNRVIGSGITSNVDVSRRISNFNNWFILFAVSFVLFYLFSNYVLHKDKSEEIKKVESFLDHYIILANCSLLLRCITYFQKETDTTDCNFIFTLVLLIDVVAQLYVFLGLDRYMSVDKFGKLGFLGASLAYTISIIFFGSVLTENLLCILLAYAALMFVFCFVGKKIINSVVFSNTLTAGVLLMSATPLLTAIYMEFIHVLNQYSIFIRNPAKYYKIAIVALLLLWVALTVLLNKKKFVVSKWKPFAFPIFVCGVASLANIIPLVTTHTPDLFESANYGVLINDFLSFGKIPLVEHYGGHMMSYVWEGLLYGIINRDFAGAAMSPYSGITIVVHVVLFYALVKIIWNDELALLTSLIIPFFSFWSYFGLGMMVCLLAIMYIRKNTYFRAALLWAGAIWCALYRLDLGFAFDLAVIVALIIYIVITKNKTALKQTGLTLIMWAAAGVLLWVILCLVKGINPVYRLLEFLYVNLSNQNWAYTSIGDSGIAAFGWVYVIFPLISVAALTYTCLSKKLRQRIKLEWWLLLMMFGFAYIFNFSRGLVRHSLAEGITIIPLFSGYIFIAFFAVCYKNRAKLFLPVFLILVVFNSLLLSSANFSSFTFADLSVKSANVITEEWDEMISVNAPVQRVVYSDTTKDYLAQYAVFDELLEEDETFIDYINKTALYFLLDRECPVYVSQSPLQLSGEFMQKQFIKQMDNIPLVLMPVDAENYHLSSMLDGVANAYRYYYVSEYIYQNYVPLFRYGDVYAVWCLKDRYDYYLEKTDRVTGNDVYDGVVLTSPDLTLYNMDAVGEENTGVVTSYGSDPTILELQKVIDVASYKNQIVTFSISFETDSPSLIELFYTTEPGEEFVAEKSFMDNINKSGTLTYSFPVTEHTRLRLDIAEQSTIKITSFKVTSSAQFIDYGYDGPFEDEDDESGETIYTYTSTFHNYSLYQLPRIWAEYDEKDAINNKALATFKKKSGTYYIEPNTKISKENGNYLKFSIRYDGHNDKDHSLSNDEYIDATIVLGTHQNGKFVEKARYMMTLQEGTHDYLVRCSTDYYWYLDQIDALRIYADGKLKDVTISLLEGD